MPYLAQSLQGQDLKYLQIVAGLWGVELSAPDVASALEVLIPDLLDRQRIEEVFTNLPEEAQHALEDLKIGGNRMLWALFTRRYGNVREMGAGRRDRERPYENPASIGEMLWYRALVGRAFFDTPSGLEECAFIPDDLLPFIPFTHKPAQILIGRPANAVECAFPIPATAWILNDACTMLAALRLGLELDHLPLKSYNSPYTLSATILKSLLQAAKLLDEKDLPQPESTRKFLESSWGEALLKLIQAWMDSQVYNELALLPHLTLEGEWTNDPLRTRRFLLNLLMKMPKGTWWSLESLVRSIHEQEPDFQRVAGDYDSWFIRDRETGAYLRGFEHWEAIEGELIRFMFCGQMYWLGLVDLATSQKGRPVTAFRLSSRAELLLDGKAPRDFPAEEGLIQAGSNARLRLHRLVPRAVRYQVARFSSWEGLRGEVYSYRLTPDSLERARHQGLRIDQLVAILQRHASSVPPSLVKALEIWDAKGTQARLEKLFVLRLSSPEILQALRTSRASRFLGEPLGPTAVIVKPGNQEKVLAALAEMGYLGSVVLEMKI